MQKKILWIALVLVLASGLQTNAQDTQKDSTYKRWFIGSSFLMLGNLIPNDPNAPEYVQLNIGYRITPKDVIQFRFKRSIYTWPLGIPFGPDFDAPGLNYPGHARILARKLATSGFGGKESTHLFMY